MIHALHGNLGSPGDWEGLELPGLETIDLWSWQERFPGISLETFGRRFTESVVTRDRVPVLLGYSLGGRLALQALAASMEQWKAVILVSVHPGLESEPERKERMIGDRDWAQRARNLPWPEFLEAWNAQPVLAGQVPGREMGGLAERREAIARAFESWSLGLQQAMDLELVGCRTPVLVVHGERDEKFGTLASRFTASLPEAEVRMIPGAGHRLPRETPGRLGEVIRTWLAGKGLVENS